MSLAGHGIYRTIRNKTKLGFLEYKSRNVWHRIAQTTKYRGLTYYIRYPTVWCNPDNHFYIEMMKKTISGFKRKIILLDICAGQGSIGFSLINECSNVKKLFSLEINPFQVNQMKNTIQHNKLKNIEVIESNVFDSVKNIKVDLIVANPPHTNKDDKDRDLYEIQRNDKDWFFHKKFFSSVGDYLSDDGIITLVENKSTSSPELFERMMPNTLKIYDVKMLDNSNYYIMFIEKVI